MDQLTSHLTEHIDRAGPYQVGGGAVLMTLRDAIQEARAERYPPTIYVRGGPLSFVRTIAPAIYNTL